MIQIARIVERLPEGIGALRAEADAEAIGGPARLMAQWEDGAQRFAGDGEALFAAFADGELAGFGGVTIERAAGEPAMRMRHLYVRPGFRRSGVGRALAGARPPMNRQGVKPAQLDAKGQS